MTEHADRPWGAYTVLAQTEDFKVKTIEVQPGQRLSYQRHARRSEHWFVVGGQGVVTLDGDNVDVRSGVAVDVPVGAAHRIWNGSKAAAAAAGTSGSLFGGPGLQPQLLSDRSIQVE